MESHYAPPERSGRRELAMDCLTVSNSPLVDGLMYVVNGLFAVLNEQRQILALNDSFLRLMGVEDVEHALGLRLGEHVHCIHACDMPAGCGTSPYCSTCGAAVAIMTAIESDRPAERTCSITIEKDNKEADFFFHVRCCPIRVNGRRFILMFMQDISVQQQRANLEQAFFHDIGNILTALVGKSQLMQHKGHWDEAAFVDLRHLIMRLSQEFSIQRTLASSFSPAYQPLYREVTVNDLLSDLEEMFYNHPLIGSRKLDVRRVGHELSLVTDAHLVCRILMNMVTNALEATGEGEAVRVFVDPGGNAVSFCVWNRGAIPGDVALRVFQRNFSTKEGLGHGLGTYSMKLFGEKVLGGWVSFTSSQEEGTTFRLTLQQ